MGAERALLRRLGGGCQAPLGALGTIGEDGATLSLRGVVASSDGTTLRRAEARGPLTATEALAQEVADQIKDEG